MHLYNLTLQPPTAITHAIAGNFSGSRQQEIIVSRGTRLELLRPDVQSGKVLTVIASDVFGCIRSLAAFRLTGGTKDYAVVGSDSGRIIILDYDPKTSSFVKIHQETFGKSGARRIVPGQYLATDPKGRSVMISANPTYAALEVDYSESDQDPTGEAFNNAEKMLTYYELDLGLNHVIRKWSEPTDPRANMLVQVPGGQLASSDRYDGPSGVLVCCEDHIIYRHMDAPQHRVPIPRRDHPLQDPDRGLIITAAVMHKMKGAFFFLLQSEEGDLYKVTIEHEEQDVKSLKIKYFDTVPVASSLCILKSGFLFVASEFGNHYLYQFQKLGDDDNEPEFSSASYASFGMADPTSPLPRAYFRPRALDNLTLVDEIESLCPIIDSKVMNLLPNSDTPQIFTACGRGARSTLRTLRHGLEVEEVVSSDLPSIPNAVWTTKLKEDVQQIGPDALLQVHPHGIRHVLADRHVTEWRVPQGGTIVCATTNKRQVVVALSTAELKGMGSTVLALSIAEVPEGRQRTPYLAVGCEDQTVRIVSLDPESTLETISLQALTAPPSAICIADMLDAGINKSQPTTFVNIGLQNGVLLRTVLDPVNGQLTDTRTRFLGTRPIRLVRVQVQRNPGILALSSRPWLNYTYQNFIHFTPLIFENLDYAWSFSTELCPEGLIGITGSLLRLRQAGKTIDDEVVNLPPEIFGRPKAPAGTWASCIRIINPVEAKTVNVIPLDHNEAAFSIAVVPFAARGGELHLVVGTAQDTFLSPRSCTSGFLRTYRFMKDGQNLELLHKTETNDVPLAVMAFQGRLVAGVGKSLRLYDMGKKKLLRKVENKNFGSAIVTLSTQGSRILVGDMQESISFAVYKPPENRLLVFADDSQPRWISAATMVDYNTVVAGDRFGNVFVNRLDPKISDQVDDDPTGAGILHEKGILAGAPHKTDMLAHFHVGDLVTSIHKVALVAGGREVLLYTGLHGTIGILVPFASKEDVDLISTLEQHMRTEQGSLVGRDHLSWRGYYVPVKGVVDGDLCETFAQLPANKQSAIAGELDRTVGELLKKLEQLRVTASGPHDPNAFFAVYDGHGGDATAKYAGLRLHHRLADDYEYRCQRYPSALRNAFLGTDAEMRSMKEFARDRSGCAAVAALVTCDNEIYAANAGDSRIVLSVAGMAKELSFDHKPGHPREYSRIKAAGHGVTDGRVDGKLAMSRSLGDFVYKDLGHDPTLHAVTSDPEIKNHRISCEDEFLVLACDGIWDCLSSQDVIDTIRFLLSRQIGLQKICEEICDLCLAPDTFDGDAGVGTDNMTIMIVALLNGKSEKEWHWWMSERILRRNGLPQIYNPARLERARAMREARERERERQQAAKFYEMFAEPRGRVPADDVDRMQVV
ncbi:Pre-mRNA-splicing factor RSE1 [Grifola frondosa]|uniref:Pre-mRNA-splicing factor RSE1 n=1 Tax=Grifola frondosa TaxID=5627 RepID=A0A1C7M2P0_GRIFR|nr:Pre-mRNA-splicing factor RSE1 [Grifola frondosa]